VQQQKANKQEGGSVAQNLQTPIVSGRERQVDDSISYVNPVNSLQSTGVINKSKIVGDKKDESRRSGGLGGGGGFGGGGGGMGYFEAEGQDPISLSNLGKNLNGSSLGLDLGFAAGRSGKDSVVLSSALSSLDINLPERGVDFYFKSPRGKATVVVRPIETKSFSRWTSLLITLGVCVGGCLICWMLFRLFQNPTLRLFATAGLLLGGVISLAFGILPVYGLLAMAGSIALIINRIVQWSWRHELAELSQ
jgi:hypothetical protein